MTPSIKHIREEVTFEFGVETRQLTIVGLTLVAITLGVQWERGRSRRLWQQIQDVTIEEI